MYAREIDTADQQAAADREDYRLGMIEMLYAEEEEEEPTCAECGEPGTPCCEHCTVVLAAIADDTYYGHPQARCSWERV